jgi:hypothetical protein
VNLQLNLTSLKDVKLKQLKEGIKEENTSNKNKLI